MRGVSQFCLPSKFTRLPIQICCYHTCFLNSLHALSRCKVLCVKLWATLCVSNSCVCNIILLLLCLAEPPEDRRRPIVLYSIHPPQTHLRLLVQLGRHTSKSVLYLFSALDKNGFYPIATAERAHPVFAFVPIQIPVRSPHPHAPSFFRSLIAGGAVHSDAGNIASQPSPQRGGRQRLVSILSSQRPLYACD